MTRAPLRMNFQPLPPGIDGRQSEAAADIQRGVQRLLRAHGFATITELNLRGGRRADIVGIGAKAEIFIVEIKSSLADFRADQKWPEYRAFCDRLAFAVSPEFPVEILPEDTGLILADRFGGEIVRPAPEHPLSAARRKTMLTSFGRTAAERLLLACDPDLSGRADQFRG